MTMDQSHPEKASINEPSRITSDLRKWRLSNDDTEVDEKEYRGGFDADAAAANRAFDRLIQGISAKDS